MVDYKELPKPQRLGYTGKKRKKVGDIDLSIKKPGNIYDVGNILNSIKLEKQNRISKYSIVK